MTTQQKRTFHIMLFVVFELLFGTVGYIVVEDDWRVLDALYMTVITVTTVTTVGFGEIRELTAPGRLFTIVLILMGIGVVAILAGQLAGFIVERELREVLGKKKMHKRLKTMKDHYVVCGYGRIGKAICYRLQEDGIPFIVVDSDGAERVCGREGQCH